MRACLFLQKKTKTVISELKMSELLGQQNIKSDLKHHDIMEVGDFFSSKTGSRKVFIQKECLTMTAGTYPTCHRTKAG